MKINISRTLMGFTLWAAVLSCVPSSYAFYNATTGTWLTRDPLGERGDANLVLAMRNDALTRIDLLGLAPGGPTSSAEAKDLCDQCNKTHNTEPPDGDPLPNTICDRIKPYLTDPQIQPLVTLFGKPSPSGWARKTCPFPRIVCVVCGSAKKCGSYQNGTLTICAQQLEAQNRGTLITTLYHELTHALQDCKLGNLTGCKDSLSREIQAYYCAGQCSSFSDCLGQAINSSCSGGACANNSQEVADAYAGLADDWNKKPQNYCFSPPLSVPPSPGTRR